MLRSKLRNRYNKNKTSHAHLAYNRQRNYCTSLLRESKKKIYEGLDPSVISDNKKFWKVTKPFFSNKETVSINIALSDNKEIHEDSSKVSQLFNDFFSNAVQNLNIDESNFANVSINENDPILRAIYKYEQHPSITKIKEVVGDDTHFSFSYVDNKTIMDEIYSLKTSKANPQNSIPANIMKENCIDPYLSIYQCGFRKGMSSQNCLLFMLEKWKKCLDKKGSAGILLIDLSKAFDCQIHGLLIAKLNAYGFDYNSIKL